MATAEGDAWLGKYIALGIDIGGTNTKLGFVDADGALSSFERIPTDAHGADPDPFLERLFACIDSMLQAQPDIVGIGASMHGEVDAERRGPIIAGNTPALRNFDMRGALEAALWAACRSSTMI